MHKPTESRVLDLHTARPGSISSKLYSPLSLPREVSGTKTGTDNPEVRETKQKIRQTVQNDVILCDLERFKSVLSQWQCF